MRCKLYRSLDQPSSFFGIRGRFMTVMGLVGAAGAVLGIVAGIVLGGNIFGFMVFLVTIVVGYFWVISLQSKMSDRDLTRLLNARSYRRYVRVPPGRVARLWRKGPGLG